MGVAATGGGMIQRLLRGWVSYVLLGLIVAFLYARAVPSGLPDPVDLRLVSEPETISVQWPKPPDPYALQQAVLSQPYLAVVLGLLSLLLIGLGTGGMVIGISAVLTGRIKTLLRFTAPRLACWTWGELGRIVLLVMALVFLFPFVRMAAVFYQPLWKLDTHAWVTLSMLALDVYVALVVLSFATGKGRSPWTVFGLTGRPRWKSVKTGLFGYMLVFPWLFLLLFLSVELAHRVGFEPPVEEIHRLVFGEHRPAVLLLTGLLACVVGPIAEEFLFRGVLYPTLRATLRGQASFPVAMVVSGVLFALIHTNVLGFLPITMLGCLLAYVYERTGSLFAPMAVHITHNTLLLSMAMVYRQLGLQ